MTGLHKIHLIACFVFVIGSGVIAKMADRKSHHVIGRTPDEINVKPYLVQIRDSFFGLFKCSATLVDPLHVVTAAHCLEELSPETGLVIVGGVRTMHDDGVQRNIVASYVHPSYGSTRFANDIAVLKLDSPMEGTNIAPVDLHYDDIADGEYLTISGWDTIEEASSSEGHYVKTARVPKIPTSDCIYKILTPSMFCAATPGKDSCPGGTGGPAIYRGKLAGVASWKKGCSYPKYPSVYTSVKATQDFLANALSK